MFASALQVFPGMSLAAELVIALLIAFAAGIVDHYRNVRPRLRLEDKRTYLFGTVCRSALANLREHDETARLNVMEIDRRFMNAWSVFDIIYSREMEGDSDKNLRLKLTQGVAGQAAARQGFCVANLEADHAPTFGLTLNQLEKTKNLTLILSMPIKRTMKMPDGSFTFTDDVIGVVNIDSKMKGAHRIYETTFLCEGDLSAVGSTLLDEQWKRLREDRYQADCEADREALPISNMFCCEEAAFREIRTSRACLRLLPQEPPIEFQERRDRSQVARGSPLPTPRQELAPQVAEARQRDRVARQVRGDLPEAGVGET